MLAGYYMSRIVVSPIVVGGGGGRGEEEGRPSVFALERDTGLLNVG